jgi:hypothetical protein
MIRVEEGGDKSATNGTVMPMVFLMKMLVLLLLQLLRPKDDDKKTILIAIAPSRSRG